MWYDEPALWQAIQKRLEKVPLFELDSNFRDPRLAAGTAQQYGQRRKDQDPVVTHAAELQCSVQELAQLEDKMQLNFLALQTELAAASAPPKATAIVGKSPKHQPVTKKAKK